MRLQVIVFSDFLDLYITLGLESKAITYSEALYVKDCYSVSKAALKNSVITVIVDELETVEREIPNDIFTVDMSLCYLCHLKG